MAPHFKKRRRQDEDNTRPKSKRVKQEPTPSRKRQGPKSSLSTSKVVNVDELTWKEVAIPDHLDDFEGFFGLEEIEGVDVVRAEEKQKIGFVVTSENLANNEQVAQEPENDGHQSIEGKSEDEASWGGFEEESKDLASSTTKMSQTASQQKSKRKSKEYAVTNGNNENIFKELSQQKDEDFDLSAWDHLGLSVETLSSLAAMKFTAPTPIQSAVIPEVLRGHDVIGKASTGSGKTLAFGIPILESFLENHKIEELGSSTNPRKVEEKVPLAMILAPTRELAHQLDAHLKDLCSISTVDDPMIATLTGGLSLHKQQRLLEKADIIIGTPGRLWEMIGQGKGLITRLRKIRFLVLDEADRLLTEGHFKEVEDILQILDREEIDEEAPSIKADGSRQTLVFSATFNRELQQKLTSKAKISKAQETMSKQESMEYLLKKLNFREDRPKFIDVNPKSQMADNLTEVLVECAALEKDLYLYGLLLQHAKSRILIFTNSITSVRRLTPFLQNLNLVAHALHSQMAQKARLRSLERFSSKHSPGSILIATDVAARGLDIGNVQCVIHYHLPRTADMYVHRSGRTARAQLSGSSILLCAPDEVAGVRRLVGKVHSRSAGGELSGSKSQHYIPSLDLDRRLIARLKPRVTLSKKIADSELAKEKHSHEDSWLRTAAEELGVDYDSDEFEAAEGTRKGRGTGRKRAAQEARALSKPELRSLKAELRDMLAQRINAGVSERYLNSGLVDMDKLLAGERGDFLGQVDEMVL